MLIVGGGSYAIWSPARTYYPCPRLGRSAPPRGLARPEALDFGRRGRDRGARRGAGGTGWRRRKRVWSSYAQSHGDAARNPLSHHLLVGGAETRDSFVHLNDKPGFGVEINWDYAKRYAA
jgi:hypothetical protein